MSSLLTGRALTEWLSERVRRLHRRACEDHDVSARAIAAGLALGDTLVLRWWHDHNAPLYALAHRASIPDSLFERVVSDLRALRAEQGTAPSTTAEAACAALVARAGELLGPVGLALADGRVSADERSTIHREVARVESQCAAVRRALDNTPAARRTEE